MTLGRPDQYDRRRKELRSACQFFGIDLVVPLESGLRAQMKSERSDDFDAGVNELVRILSYVRPGVVITHHDKDAHPDHERTNKMTVAALESIEGIDCVLAEGEYWREVEKPNLQVEVLPANLIQLMQGVSYHLGELERNRYDLYMLTNGFNNARRGELVTGWGTPAAPFLISYFYRVRRFHEGVIDGTMKPMQLAADQPISLITV